MDSPEATIYCPNPLCQAPNPESHRFCQQCRTVLPKRYLWVVGAEDLCHPGLLLADRYWCKQAQIVLDTKPGLALPSVDELPTFVEPYLRLIPYSPQIPQVYTLLPYPEHPEYSLVLLEQVPLYPTGSVGEPGKPGLEGTLMPEIGEVWSQGSALRQLNWLWQISQLWEPLRRVGVSHSLLTPWLLRAEGAMVRLLELRSDRATSPTLADLGLVWQQWLPGSQPEVADFLKALYQQLVQGTIQSAEHLTLILDRALQHCGQGQTRQLQIATLTDQGPTRQRNEDACYPPSGTSITVPLGQTAALPPLVIVCDGIGGHEGGNIASNLAIATIQQHLQPLAQTDPATGSATLTTIRLEEASLAANDVISQRNDLEKRQERQRMGTTLVMAWGQTHELYLAHVGDSRAYRITRTGCHQVTLDDDLATREVRLGYSLYRDALQQPSAGSLVQALGMSVSSLLHPTVQRYVLDEDCLFLLCSDGLSDNDRVEENWQTVLLPILDGLVNPTMAAKQLVAIANQQNGHDNVTVGLVWCRVTPDPKAVMTVPESLTMLSAAESEPPGQPRPVVHSEAPEPWLPKTQDVQAARRSHPNLGSILLGLFLVLGIGGFVSYLLIKGLDSLTRPESASSPEPTAPDPNSPIPTAPTIPSTATEPLPILDIQSRMQVIRSASGEDHNAIALLPQAGMVGEPGQKNSSVPVNSVLEVVGKQKQTNQTWLQLKVCSLPEGISPAALPTTNHLLPTARPGDTGWVLQDAITPLVTTDISLNTNQLGTCANLRQPGKKR